MKLLLVLSICITMALSLFACNDNVAVNEINNWLAYDESLGETDYGKEFSYEEVIGMSMNIVRAKAVAKDLNDLYVFTFEILDQLKWSIDTAEISVYTTDSFFKEDEEYVLYLESSKSPYYETIRYVPVYLSYSEIVSDDSILTFRWGNLQHSIEDSYKEISDLVRETPDTSPLPLFHSVNFIDTTDLEVILSQSDYISLIKTEKVIADSSDMIAYECSVKKEYKGKLKENPIIYLPSNSSLEKEYLVTLTEVEGVYMITSLSGFIDIENKNELDKILKILNK